MINKYFLQRYKWHLYIAIAVTLLQFAVFKYMYPYAGFISGDSYVYLETAYWNLEINTYPIGYPMFLRVVNTFTRSDTALMALQYLLLQGSALVFLFTLFHYCQPGRWLSNCLFAIILFNPVFLYISNYVSSDALFISLSLLWFSTLIGILNRPAPWMIVVQVVLLFLAFTVRYNALYYPFISAGALLLSRQQRWLKLAGIVAGFLVVACFILHTRSMYQRLTDTRQFSPFSGWQIANNALYGYRHVLEPVVNMPARFQELDGMVRTYFNANSEQEEAAMANTWFMWDTTSPLHLYMNRQFIGDTTAGTIKKWAVVAPLFADYGVFLIRHYPMAYTKYYLLPNTLKYCVPPVEFLEFYNMDKDSVAPIAQRWFGYKSLRVKNRFGDRKVVMLNLYPKIWIVTNVAFLLAWVAMLMFKGFRKASVVFTRTLLLVTLFWIANFLFSVLAAPIALRFQVFPLIILLCFSFLLAAFIYKIEQQQATPPFEQQSAINNKYNRFKFPVARSYIGWAVMGTILLFTCFKLLYPFADFSNDSYTYIDYAAANLNISYRPIGYSKFLRLMSAFSTSDTVLAAVQYLCIQLSVLYFFLTIRRCFHLPLIITRIIFVFLVFNPAALYLANYIGPDGLFAAFSLCWLAHLICIIHRPRRYDLPLQAALLLLILCFRYNALYYPLVTVLALLLSRHRQWIKVAGLTGIFLITIGFVGWVRDQTYLLTGTRTFSAFSGWQMANNALYMYKWLAPEVQQHSSGGIPKMDMLVRNYFNTTRKEQQPLLQETEYLWNAQAPLKQYFFSYMRQHGTGDSMRAWHAVGPLYAGYGSRLIIQHPLAFAQYFVWPNTKAFLCPSLEIFKHYNMGQDSVERLAAAWFRYASPKVFSHAGRGQAIIIVWLPVLYGLASLLFIPVIILFISFNRSRAMRLSALLVVFFLSVNFIFSVLAAPVVFRYQYFPMLVVVTFCLLFIRYIPKYRLK